MANHVANLNGNMANIQDTIERLRQDVDAMRQEGLILLYNANAGPMGVLYNPTVLLDGWAAELAAPNPRTCDKLKAFSSIFFYYT